MKKAAYGFVFLIFKGISLLPMPLLYGLSKLLYMGVYHLWGYRKRVVRANLARAFPNKTAVERRRIEKQFYQYFCDLWVETLKSLSLSSKALQKRVALTNPEVLTQIEAYPQGQLMIISHYGNIEWLALRLDIAFQSFQMETYSVYTPPRNPLFDRLIRTLRGKFGLRMLPMRHAMIQTLRLMEKKSIVGFLLDQAPKRSGPLYFAPFLHQLTATHTSLAKIALRVQKPLYYADMQRVKRGIYRITLQPIPLEPYDGGTEAGIQALTDQHVSLLESAIRRDPAYWLWSHRRWKHSPRPGDHISPRWQPKAQTQ